MTETIPVLARSRRSGAKTVFKAPSPAMWPGSKMIGNEGKPKSEYSASLPVIDRAVIVRLHVPVLDTGKGSFDEQASTL